MNAYVNGFLIVRKSSSMEFVEPYNKRFIVNEKEYEGFQRERLYDLIEDYSNKKLPLEIHLLVDGIINSHVVLEPFFENLHDAKKILNHCRGINDFNEIIAVEIIADKGEKITIDENFLEWLGYDIITYMNNSLLFLGLFSHPNYFKVWIDKVNNHGLFNDDSEIKNYIEDYLNLASKDIVEDYVFPEKGFQVVKIAKVIIDQ